MSVDECWCVCLFVRSFVFFVFFFCCVCVAEFLMVVSLEIRADVFSTVGFKPGWDRSRHRCHPHWPTDPLLVVDSHQWSIRIGSWCLSVDMWSRKQLQRSKCCSPMEIPTLAVKLKACMDWSISLMFFAFRSLGDYAKLHRHGAHCFFQVCWLINCCAQWCQMVAEQTSILFRTWLKHP